MTGAAVAADSEPSVVTGAVSTALAPAAVPAAPLTPLQALQAIRDANAKLLEQQAKAIQQLDEIQKSAAQLKAFGKRG